MFKKFYDEEMYRVQLKFEILDEGLSVNDPVLQWGPKGLYSGVG